MGKGFYSPRRIDEMSKKEIAVAHWDRGIDEEAAGRDLILQARESRIKAVLLLQEEGYKLTEIAKILKVRYGRISNIAGLGKNKDKST